MNINFFCTKAWILGDVPHQVWEAQTADPNANVLMTRFLHNKLSLYSNNFARCYLSYLSPDFINAAFTIVGLILFLAGIYFLVVKKNWRILTILLLAPLFPLFSFPESKLIQGVILYSAQGLAILAGFYYLVKNR